jgi:hypothetical protein
MAHTTQASRHKKPLLRSAASPRTPACFWGAKNRGMDNCKTRLNTMSQVVGHLKENVAAAVDREFSGSGVGPHQIPVALNRISLSQQ